MIKNIAGDDAVCPAETDAETIAVEIRAAAYYSERMNFPTNLFGQGGLPSADALASLLTMSADLGKIWRRARGNGMFEILEYEAALELLDVRGERAHFRKRLRVRFLQDNVIAFQDYAWGDGEIFLQYRCAPGKIVDRYREGGRWNVLISLRETKNAGDVEEFHVERKLRGSFLSGEGWWETSLRHRARNVQVSVLFPAARPCKGAVLIERHHGKATPLDTKAVETLPDGRQRLTWQSDNVKRFETYMLQWRW